jgi:hypothetical protein
MRTRLIAFTIILLGLFSPAEASEGRCKALQDFLNLYDEAQEEYLGMPISALASDPKNKEHFTRFVAAYTGDYTKTILEGLLKLKTAYPEVGVIDASVGGFPTTRDKMLAVMKEKLAGGTSAPEAFHEAMSQHEPLGEAFVMWFVPERGRCDANR